MRIKAKHATEEFNNTVEIWKYWAEPGTNCNRNDSSVTWTSKASRNTYLNSWKIQKMEHLQISINPRWRPQKTSFSQIIKELMALIRLKYAWQRGHFGTNSMSLSAWYYRNLNFGLVKLFEFIIAGPWFFFIHLNTP